MSDQLERSLRQKAVNDFYELRRKADLENILGLLQGKSTDLMPYDEVRQNLRPIESARRILENIPIEKIVGSVNRTTDFSRSFLPRNTSDLYRWTNVRVGVETMMGLPPIEAYRVGDVYFILDGHHRVSVAREVGADTIEGYVIPVYTRVPLSPGDSPDDLIIKSEYADFLTQTKIDDLRPDANLLVSVPGQYPKLLEHIYVHRYFMGLKQKQFIPENDAVVSWYDEVYLPVARIIREKNFMRDFPDRTETDLYLWILDHRVALSGGSIGWEVPAEKAADDLSSRFSQAPRRKLSRLAHRVLRTLVPQPLEPGPPPGSWRNDRPAPHRGDHLFDDILVALPGKNIGENALHLSLEFARRERARLTGLHIVADDSQRSNPDVVELQSDFKRLCEQAGTTSRSIVDAGASAAEVVCHRSAWVDLTVFHLAYPPPQKAIRRLHSGVRQLIRYCASPLLAVPNGPYNLNNLLLAYGPGRKSEEALYVAAYLAAAWNMTLTVVSVLRNGEAESSADHLIERARTYIEAQQIKASYILEKYKDPALAILINAEVVNAGMIITGSYEGSTFKEVLFGSTVDRVLRSTRRPVLICQ